ncbi:hypothetical protein FQR65_LT00095 [Abscondita terminalis]|nr:hypothetical protein FQR65_LT00095 [Abscondita terminalis]
MFLKIFWLLLSFSIISTRSEETNGTAYRLRDICFPSHYEIKLNVPKDFETNGKFFGQVKILFEVTSETSEIEFHSNKLTFNENNIHLLQTGVVSSIFNVKSHEFLEKLQKVKVTFDRPLQVRTNYSLYIDQYEGVLGFDMAGFYRAKYKDAQGNYEWIATTQFETTDARKAFPCFDEPRYKASFTIFINHPSEYHALSNAAVKEVRLFSDSTKQTSFEETPIMSTYLVAFAVTKYVSLSNTKNKIKHVIWSSIETIPLGQYALSMSPKLMEVLENFLGVPYSISNLSTVNHMSIPDFSAGAMENWGFITYRETALLWNPQTSSARNKQRVGTVVAHELAHMWFGNLVTPLWWSYAWLNEGFARFFEYMATAEVETDWDLENQFIVEQQQRILITEALDKAKPITNTNVSTPSEVSGMFDTTTYSKGGSIVRMMYLLLGKETFYRGLQSYLLSRKFNSVVPQQLFSALEKYVQPNENLPDTLETIMSGWTENAGFPVVTVRLDNDHLILQQTQFGKKNITNGRKWFIPITYTTSKEKNFENLKPKIWMKPNQPETIITDLWDNQTSWILFNIKSSAFIRVNYDDTLWDRINLALNKSNFDKIENMNRAQIVDDAMNLARSNLISYQRAFNIVSYLVKETDYYPWYSAFNAFSFLRRRIPRETKLRELLNKHIQKLMHSMYKNATSSSPDRHLEKYKQVMAFTWGCKLNMKECVSKMQSLFEKYKQNNTPFDPNLRDVVYCTATRYATDKNVWEYLWEKLKNSTSADETSTLISGLGCTKNEELLYNYLNKSIDDHSVIRRQDGQSVFAAVIGGSSQGVNIGLKFLINNFQNMSERYGGMNALSSVISGLADRLTTKEQVDQLEAFITENRSKLKEAVTAAGIAIETAKKNLEWMEKNEKELRGYLQSKSSACFNAPSVFIVCVVFIFKVIL